MSASVRMRRVALRILWALMDAALWLRWDWAFGEIGAVAYRLEEPR